MFTTITFDPFEAVAVPGFLPDGISARLVELHASSARRKTEYDVRTRWPRPIGDAADLLRTRTGIITNIAILKQYRLDDEVESGAYEAHTDPPELQGIPLCLFTLTGSAGFEFWDAEGESRRIHCTPGLAVFLRSDLRHRVAPPDLPSGERRLLFLGHRDEIA